MKHLFVDISSHGFGHLAQVAPILTALRAQLPALQLTIRCGLPEAKARFSPMSSSKAVARTNRSATPGAEMRNVAISLAPLASSPAASVTACQTFQFDGLNVNSAWPETARFASPEARDT